MLKEKQISPDLFTEMSTIAVVTNKINISFFPLYNGKLYIGYRYYVFMNVVG